MLACGYGSSDASEVFNGQVQKSKVKLETDEFSSLVRYVVSSLISSFLNISGLLLEITGRGILLLLGFEIEPNGRAYVSYER